MSILSRIFGREADREKYRLLYGEVVALGRDPAWYEDGAVPDTIDGRFDMIAAVLALVLLRIEQERQAAGRASALVAELFIEDMEGSIRQIGIGDLMVGKQVGRMMGALGGRLTAFRTAIGAGAGFEAAVRRNIFHDRPPSADAVAYVSRRLERFWERLAETSAANVLAGEVPRP